MANRAGGPYPDGSLVIVGFYEPLREGDVISQGNYLVRSYEKRFICNGNEWLDF